VVWVVCAGVWECGCEIETDDHLNSSLNGIIAISFQSGHPSRHTDHRSFVLHSGRHNLEHRHGCTKPNAPEPTRRSKAALVFFTCRNLASCGLPTTFPTIVWMVRRAWYGGVLCVSRGTEK
jgi:hypothetical protein